jgi:hypothetical protein
MKFLEKGILYYARRACVHACIRMSAIKIDKAGAEFFSYFLNYTEDLAAPEGEK